MMRAGSRAVGVCGVAFFLVAQGCNCHDPTLVGVYEPELTPVQEVPETALQSWPPDGGGDRVCDDADGDGFGTGPGCLGLDCDDADPAMGDTGVRSCYSGAAGTDGVGLCRSGTQACTAGVFGECVGEVLPGDESCDGLDNDCDGEADEAVTRSCYSGPAGTEAVGVCHGGIQTCSAGVFGACEGEVLPGAELCDIVDNDCDGESDETLSRSCYSGDPGTEGVGACLAGTQVCVAGTYGACVGEVLPAAESCDDTDNDCNGQVDDAVVRSCYTGAPGTEGVGSCHPGIQACTAGVFGACVGEALPAAESCDGADNDCDGAADEALTRACYSGPAGSENVGVCHGGIQTCVAGAFGACAGEVVPSAESCDNLDNNCDGAADEAVTRACYSGPAGTEGVGVCHGGSQTCAAGSFGACTAEVLPSTESCDNQDNNCDGAVDDGVTRACYSGPPGTEGVGLCHGGTQTCAAGAFGACAAEVLPSTESCDNLDNNCDGAVDEAVTRACYSGPPGTEGVGLCHGGTQTCAAGSFGACTAEVLPASESCDNQDNNCDGAVDDAVTRACYSGPAGTEGVGLCHGGTQTCAAGAFGACTAEVLPEAESCDDQDNDCDGALDEAVTRACYSGPPGTEGVGVCHGGTQTCAAGAFGACTAEVLPSSESCDNRDNNCDGQTDEAVTRACYSGAAGTEGVGLCHGGTQTCAAGVFGSCAGQVVPAAESCDNLDNDCDAQTDEAVTRSCYTGPGGTQGVGACQAGTQTCSAGVFAACEGEVLPSAETCDNQDNDCDGNRDEALTRTCYSGPDWTDGVGVCHGGQQTCTAGTYGSCVGQLLPSPETCDNLDNNCNGATDEAVTRTCYSGPAFTDGVGSCHGGTQSCTAGTFGTCIGQVLPAAETCDAQDENCNGQIAEAVTRTCYGGPAGTQGIGPCHGGTQSCSAGVFGACAGEVQPAAESCDAQDNDCDGQIDESLVRACYGGPAGTEGIGLCHGGSQTCVAGAYGTCAGQVTPASESCDAQDNDCDGQSDESLARACYSGPAGTEDVGSCHGGTQTCVAGLYGTCAGELTPAPESCDNQDSDCDGTVDEDLSRACYSGPPGTEGVGVCQGGTQTCVAGSYGACAGEVAPSAEGCDNQDNDCNGQVDEAVFRSCYGGPAGTSGVGVCRAGNQTCEAGAFGTCVDEVRPGPVDICASGEDEDCNGFIDEAGCAGVGTWVCASCAGASDTNPGTQERPLKTINRGLVHAVTYGFNKVYVANRDANIANIYAEDLTLLPGVSIEGRWVPATPWWRSSAVRTVIHDTTAAGLKIPAGIGRDTVLEGFEVRSAGGIGGASLSSAVRITSSAPTLRDVWAGGFVPGAPAVATSVGILVSGTSSSPAAPRIEGLAADSPGGATGGSATSLAAGIKASFAHLDVQFLDVRGGTAPAGGTATGVLLADSASSQLRDSKLVGGNAGTCLGVDATGAVDGISVSGNWLNGCDSASPVAATSSTGARFFACSLSTSGLAPVVTGNIQISGGKAALSGGTAVGIAALDGCPLDIFGNPSVYGGDESERGVGVLCSYRSPANPNGADSACVIRGNSIYGGFSSATLNSEGVSCEGSCAAKTASCAGSCRELFDNNIIAPAGTNLIHVNVVRSSPLIERNRVGLGGAGVACLHQTSVTGLRLDDSASRIINNIVMGGPCEKVFAVVQLNQSRADGSYASPDVNANTLIGGGSSASTTGSESYGVVLRTPLSTGKPPRLGSYRNNIIVGGQNASRTCVREEDARSDPAALWNNDLYNLYRASPDPVTYRNEGSKDLATVGEVNALTDTSVGANLGVDPKFVNNFFDFHILSVSPMRGMGTSTGAPPDDCDGQGRANPGGSLPDIGADEVP
ncbi:MAG: MopE-related protein [Myxococcaceae bacterium]